MIIFIVVIGLSALIFVHELGHFLFAKLFGIKVEEFGFGFPPRLFGKRVGETVYSFNLLPFGGFVKIHGEDGEFTDERSFAAQPVWRRSITVLAGVVMNVVLGWFLLSVIFAVGAPKHLVISDVAPDSPAGVAGLKSGDLILEARYGSEALSDPIETQNFIDFVKRSAGGEINLKVQRGKEVSELSLVGRANPPPGQGSLGIALIDIGFTPLPFFGAIVKGLEATAATLYLVASSFFNFFLKIFVTPEVLQSVAGPVGIFLIARDTGSLGIIYLLQLIAIISLNLAVLNLVPFPALDGGRFLFLVIEKIKGSPVSRKYERAINTVGFVLLVTLMIVVTIQDVGRISQ